MARRPPSWPRTSASTGWWSSRRCAPEFAQSDAAKKRFDREACLCSALDNPNICSVFDVGETGDLHYIVMQYVEGPTLKQLLAEW